MYWKLILNQDNGTLELWDDDLVTQRSWEEKRNTSQEILSALKEIQSEQDLSWSDVPEFRLALELSPHATARRIAETFEKTYTLFVA
jgi:hypothetical protein